MGRRFAILLLLCLSGCGDRSQSGGAGSSAASPGPGRLKILATTGMIADAARQVGGDLVDVMALMGPGVDPHLYQPTARDQGKLKAAQLILYNGLHLEGKMVDLFESLAKQKSVVAVSRDIPVDRLLAWSDSAGMHDPHIWFDVKLWQLVVRTIAHACGDADPANSATYEGRAAEYLAELDRLDEECRDLAGTLPAEQRVLITSHDAFHYFGRAYGFEVVGIQGISTDSEAGLKAITDAVDLIRRRKLRAIFPETSVPRAAIERVAADGHVQLGTELFSDSLGAPDAPAGTYAGMIRANMQNIVNALRDP
ncbi:MAG TPA: zinc ABC transporter substrate-binding protein [Planctomycetaceae bacterium]